MENLGPQGAVADRQAISGSNWRCGGVHNEGDAKWGALRGFVLGMAAATATVCEFVVVRLRPNFSEVRRKGSSDQQKHIGADPTQRGRVELDQNSIKPQPLALCLHGFIRRVYPVSGLYIFIHIFIISLSASASSCPSSFLVTSAPPRHYRGAAETERESKHAATTGRSVSSDPVRSPCRCTHQCTVTDVCIALQTYTTTSLRPHLPTRPRTTASTKAAMSTSTTTPCNSEAA